MNRTTMKTDEESSLNPLLPASAAGVDDTPKDAAAAAAAEDSDTAAADDDNNSNTSLHHHNRRPVPHELCQSLERNLHNLGKSLSCSICHSTPSLGSAVLLSECVHLFCSTCLQMAFRNQQQQQQTAKKDRNKSGLNCPVCRQVVTRRSAIDAPDNYQQATLAYKRLLQSFGMAPMLYAPHLCMTQVPITTATTATTTMSPLSAKANYQMSILWAEHYASRRLQQQPKPLASAKASSTTAATAATAPTALEREQNEIVRINRRHYRTLAVNGLAKRRRMPMRANDDNNPHDDIDEDDDDNNNEDLVGDSFEAGADEDAAAAATTDKLAGLVGSTTTTTSYTRTAHTLLLLPHNSNSNVAATQDSWIDKARDQSAADAAWEEQRRIDEEEDEEREEGESSPKDKEVLETKPGHAEKEEEVPLDEKQEVGEDRQDESEHRLSSLAAAVAVPPVLVGGTADPDGTTSDATAQIGRAATLVGARRPDPAERHEQDPLLSVRHGELLDRMTGHPLFENDSDDEFDLLNLRSPFARTPLPPPASGIPPNKIRAGQEPDLPPPPPPQQHPDSSAAASHDDVDDSTVPAQYHHVTPFPSLPKDASACWTIDNGVENAAPDGKGHSDMEGEATKNVWVRNGNKGATVHPKQSEDAPNHGEGLNLDDSGPASTHGALPVGTVVTVAPRTWPGMNKLGGVGRVTKVHQLPEAGQGVAYSVQYVLGGTESRVDAVFVTRYSDDGMGTTTKRSACGEESGAGDKAISTTPSARRHRKSNRLEQHNAAGWSPSLIEKLASEGFDVAAVGPTGKAAVHNQRKRPGTEIGADNRRSKKLRRIGSSIAEFVRRRLPRGGGQHADSGEVAARSPNQKENRPDNKTTPTPPNTPPSLPVYSIAECCRRADAFYNDRVQQATSKGCFYVATSSLTDEDNAALDRLCKDTKSSKVQVKRMDRIDAKKTTFCLIRTDEVQRSDAESESDLTATKRTIKVMQATLAGVPLVCSSWLQLCQNRKEVCPPTPKMWVRALPCPSKYTAFGVARLAAHLYDDACYRPLAGIAVHFCGTIPRQKEADLSLLLRDAGATLIPNSAAFLSHLAKSTAQASTSVLVCGSGVKLGRAVEAKLRLTVAGAVRVVHPGWVFDCVSSGQVLGASDYEPKESGTQARDLWKVTNPSGAT